MNRKLDLLRTYKIGVLYGGISSERAISLKSGRAVSNALKKINIHSVLIDTSKTGYLKKLSAVDLAFIALHGEGGEDGVIQRILERVRVPYTGSTPLASRNAFDKCRTKKILIKHKIRTPDFKQIKGNRGHIKGLANFGACFVKPSRNGSSVGIFSSEDPASDADKIKACVRNYKDVIIEKKIKGREFTVGIVGKEVLPVIELRPKRAFYDYKAKYTKGMTKYIVPAKISAKASKRMQRLALKTHQALGLRDFSRVDFMVDPKGKEYVLEANAIPGMTELSLLPKAAKKAGMKYEDLCLRILEEALGRI